MLLTVQRTVAIADRRAICAMRACVYRRIRCMTGPLRPNAILDGIGAQPLPRPAICTTARLSMLPPPMTSEMSPTTSLPTSAIYAESPSSSSTNSMETMAFVGKFKWLSIRPDS